jgi:phosphatidate cytidylyltransferase
MGLLGGIYYFRTADFVIGLIFAGLIWWIYAFIAVIAYQQGKNIIPAPRIIKAVIGLLVLIPAWLSLILLHASTDGAYLVLFLFVLIWAADSTAYIIGSRFGKRRLLSRISPGKSWEGVYGALFASAILGLGWAMITGQQNDIVQLLFLCIITVMFSILGDLVESMFKRTMGLKNSSDLLPGHGGVLDRVDSLTSAAPIYFIGLWLLGGNLW